MSTRRRTRTAQVDLSKSFNAVTKVLKENRQSLNEADEYNHNHGDNMVETFQVITKAMREKNGSVPSDQLAYASEVLGQRANSGSAQLYSQNLAEAANQLRGEQRISQEDAMLLVQTLLGGGQAAPPPAYQNQAASGDLMDGLMGALLGGGAQQQQPTAAQAQPDAGDLLGGLLGTFMGGGSTPRPAPQASTGQAASSINLGMLLNAGMAFYQARQEGAEPMQALVQAVMAGSQMQASPHRKESGQMVAETLLTTLSSMLAKSR